MSSSEQSKNNAASQPKKQATSQAANETDRQSQERVRAALEKLKTEDW